MTTTEYSFPEETSQQDITIEHAERILRKRYWDEVRGFVKDLGHEIEVGNLTTPEEADEYLWQTLDSCSRVIYTHNCLDGLRWSDNDSTCEEELGEESLTKDGQIHWSGLMFMALRADCLDMIGDMDEFVHTHQRVVSQRETSQPKEE